MDARIVLTTGGTGGHIFPARALAEELIARGWEVHYVTDARGAAIGSMPGAVEVHAVRAKGIAGSRIGAKIKGALNLTYGAWQARRLLRRLRPAAVIGFGGYASLPATMAALTLGIPVALHEQNAVFGRANRLIAKRAGLIATSFEHTAELPDEARGRVVCTGNPVRAGVAQLAGVPYPAMEANEPMRLLVTGGSQGAQVFSTMVPEAFAALAPEIRRQFQVAQQCRPEEIDRTRIRYEQLGMTPELATFFDDVPERLAAAHLVIARAGASTVAELAVSGRPAVLVPLPGAIDDHQTANARVIEEAGGAWTMPQAAFTADALAHRLEMLITLPETLAGMAEASRGFGRLHAARHLADAVETLARRGSATRNEAIAEGAGGGAAERSQCVREEAA